MSELSVSIQSHLKKYRLSVSEYEKMKLLLKREPNVIDWSVFSALWSEHCSYKSSKVHLKKFAQTLNHKVLSPSGENAGIIDLGEGEQIAFKMESHNHPSFIEPFQGAATGVGGILRDIFAMGARPIALANYLAFGDPDAPRMSEIMKGVVSGISYYGNCVGVPMITGQTEFHNDYNRNVLVNALAIGLIEKNDQVMLSTAVGEGAWVVYYGAHTGKDGVHGAAMASESFGEEIQTKKPNIQIGDPYFEKILIESCLEIFAKNLVIACQDMGAAGLTSSTFEMASKGQIGMNLHLDQVPLRTQGMSPDEILLSESQERMIFIVTPEKFPALQEVAAKWCLPLAHIGTLKKNQGVRVYWKNELLSEIDPSAVVDQAPVYERSYNQCPQLNNVAEFDFKVSAEDFEALLAQPRFSNKAALYRQFDTKVQLRTVQACGEDSGLLRLKGSGRGLAIALGGRSEVLKMNSQLGALDAAFYPSLKMAVKGSAPVGLTDCLNFGNPEKPEVMSDFVVAVEELVRASQALKAPVVSGNVSFYNETLGTDIPPTPAIGVVGLRPNVEAVPKNRFQQEGSYVLWLRRSLIEADFSWADSWQVHAQFSGSWSEEDTSQLGAFTLKLAEQINVHKPLSSQVVGRGGLLAELFRMGREKKLGVSDAILDQYSLKDFFQDSFYQFVFEFKDEAQLLKFAKEFSQDAKLESISLGPLKSTTGLFGSSWQTLDHVNDFAFKEIWGEVN